MDPALLNYLQSQQINNAPTEQQTAKEQYNPFDIGIAKAVDSARQSLGMTDKQQNRALRNGMLAFADKWSQQPRERGFFNNFAKAGSALSPAISAYDNTEDNSLNENNKLANQILHYQATEQDRASQEEERAWRRQFAESQLGEQRRHHDLMYNGQKGEQSMVSQLPNNFIPIESKSERLMYSKDRKASGEILKELSSIRKDYDEFKTLSKNDVINPMTPYGVGKVANATKDLFGYFSNNKNLRKETSKRQALDAKLGKFSVELERKIKGGVLSEAMVKRFENKGLLPSLGDAPDVFEEKLNNLTQEMSERYKASEASLRYGAHISPADLEELERGARGKSNPMAAMNNEETVLMQDGNGVEYRIPPEEVEGAMSEGLELVGQ